MSDTTIHLPRGIRLNNPGNLRNAVGPDTKTRIVEGFASFATLSEGTSNLFWLIHNYSTHLGLSTLPAFIARYAPASENDLAAYTRAMVQRLHVNPLKVQTADLALTDAWRAIDFARALIFVENGAPPLHFNGTSEWVAPSIMVDAIRRTGKWNL
jgi:hypothetical protein